MIDGWNRYSVRKRILDHDDVQVFDTNIQLKNCNIQWLQFTLNGYLVRVEEMVDVLYEPYKGIIFVISKNYFSDLQSGLRSNKRRF